MRIYLSGDSGLENVPEVILPKERPHIMLTYVDIYKDVTSCLKRLYAYLDPKTCPRAGYGSMFIDSGAFTLYNKFMANAKGRKGKDGKPIKKDIKWGWKDATLDWSRYSLKKGKRFRHYCDSYGAWIQSLGKTDLLFANVDVIGNPDLTWETQKFLEEEYGIRPVPVVHCSTPMSYVDRYIENGYDLLGVGGSAQGTNFKQYCQWADGFFGYISPNGKPIIRTHGFAMTSLTLMMRWPWWSVDSASWVKMSAFGHIYAPRRTKKAGGFDYSVDPHRVCFSRRPPKEVVEKKAEKVKLMPPDNRPGGREPHPLQQIPFQHYDSIWAEDTKADIRAWLKEVGVKLGKETPDGKELERGVVTHYRVRRHVNVYYLLRLQEYLTKNPPRLQSKTQTRKHREITLT